MKIDTKDLFNEVSDEILSFNNSDNTTIPPEMLNGIEVYDEEVLKDTLAKDFSYQIKNRGEDYYYGGNIQNVYRTNNKYYAKVKGNSNKSYEVSIEVFDENNAHYECTCPCDYPCKHEYAVIMAISNLEYSEIELKTPVKEKEVNIKSLLQKIPAEELKNYFLSLNVIDENTLIELPSFSEYFRKYYPKQKYEYYYNNLYNDLMLDTAYVYKIATYIDRANQYLSGDEFDEAFKIVKSIIEAYNDTGKLNFNDYVFDIINKLGMILRIAYRRGSNEVKEDIIKWSKDLEEKSYYNNYYIEDIILSLK